jgi:hypothetical protein
MIKAFFTMIVGCVLFLPCLLLFNESGNFTPNLAGLLYVVVLCILSHTKVGKTAIYKVLKANKTIEDKLIK